MPGKGSAVAGICTQPCASRASRVPNCQEERPSSRRYSGRIRTRPHAGGLPLDQDPSIKLAIYRHFARTGERPTVADIAGATGVDTSEAKAAFARLRASRVLVLEDDGESIRMAPPFSGVPTQHVVVADGRRYYANCAWDSLGIPAALHVPAMVESRCEQSGEPFRLNIRADGPEASDWLFHCAVPAARWWRDIVFT